jgi:type IV pilus assembly protein PilV
MDTQFPQGSSHDCKPRSRKRFMSGFTMLEMLVSLVILSVGLLGVAILQTKGQQFNHNSYLYTQASYLAYDIMDRIRANEPAAKTGSYQKQLPTELSSDCTKQTCTSGQMVDFDLYSWKTLLEKTLPGGEAQITWGSPNRYTVSIKWLNEQKDEADKYVQNWVITL